MKIDLIKIIAIFMILVVSFVFVNNVNADVSTDFPTGISIGEDGGVVEKAAKSVWATVVTIVQILAFAAVVFAGLRYMFATSEQKADIKKSMGILTLGAILVFASATVISFIYGFATEIF